MENSASSIAAELKRQIVSQLPTRPLVGGGFRNFTIKASTASAVSQTIGLDVYGILLQQLAEECPEWEIEIQGELDSLEVTFSR